MPEPLLEVRDLTKHFPLFQPWLAGLARRQVGTVVAVEGVGERAVASIDFRTGGVKRLLLRYAPVEKL